MVQVRVGQRVPPAWLASLDAAGELSPVHTEKLLCGVKALVIGVPGAFTPICTHQHLPGFIERAPAIRKAGFGAVICIASSDPFATAEWAHQIDPAGRLTFLSDGNLAFTRACGLASREEALFLGERSRRYLMCVEDAVVTRLHVESSVLQVSCTSADEVLLD
jgi:2-Cys peroxiredoxin 5